MDDLISRHGAIDAVMKLMPSLTTPDGSGQFDDEIFRMQEMFVDIGQVLFYFFRLVNGLATKEIARSMERNRLMRFGEG